ncbi:MAG: cupin domain-containing protein [Acidaminococcales bacterium]|jgi:transcriptional regulator with XRE-family HTH domain|nr:cupin domain-containing protein [Acidaminococcales bacterium]
MNIGAKIRRLRQEKSLTQDELASRCELSKGFISQLENDLTSPSLNTLANILESLGTTLKDFFNDYSDERIVFRDEDFYQVEDREYKFKIEWIIPNAQKNVMEPIIITLEPGGRSKEEIAHQGEEFGYVLSGSVYIHLGNKKYKAHQGEAFSYKSNANHYMTNVGKRAAKILWIAAPPSF